MSSKLLCFTCKHFNQDSDKITCKAFPNGIPEEIWIGENNHSQPFPDQKNAIVFEPKTKTKPT